MTEPFTLDPMALAPAVGKGRLSVIITFLEMTAPPDFPPPPAPTADVMIMRALQPTPLFYRFLYTAVGEPWLWHERRRWADRDLARVVQSPTVDIRVLYVRGAPAGYFELNRGDDPAITDLSYFGLMPEYIGFKLGPWFLRQAVDAAWEGAAKIKVNTCTFDHPRALPLYQSMGFRPVRHRMVDIPDPRVHGPLPRHAAPHIPINE